MPFSPNNASLINNARKSKDGANKKEVEGWGSLTEKERAKEGRTVTSKKGLFFVVGAKVGFNRRFRRHSSSPLPPGPQVDLMLDRAFRQFIEVHRRAGAEAGNIISGANAFDPALEFRS